MLILTVTMRLKSISTLGYLDNHESIIAEAKVEYEESNSTPETVTTTKKLARYRCPQPEG